MPRFASDSKTGKKTEKLLVSNTIKARFAAGKYI